MQDAITVKNLSVSYRPISTGSIRAFRKARINQEISALRDISFSVKRGEIVGVIGSNGSGKSTLLKAIASIFRPDSGSVDLHGNSVSLLSLGLGFNSALTGRDNIYLSGIAMGFKKKEIDLLFDEIAAFSELGAAIDRPVKTYSSGMHSKLTFAIAMYLQTDIILIDEILSVGDYRFRRKSQEKLESIILSENRTVLIVSHNLNSLRKLCTRVLWIEQGVFREFGDPGSVIENYQREMLQEWGSPETPKLIAAESDGQSITVRWKESQNAEYYKIYRKIPGGNWSALASFLNETYFEDMSAVPGVEYFYTVRAFKGKEKSGYDKNGLFGKIENKS